MTRDIGKCCWRELVSHTHEKKENLFMYTSYSLRSDSETLLVIPKVTRKTFGDRAFFHAGPTVWNALPSSLRNCRNIDSFKVQLKTYLLRKLLLCNFIFLLLLSFLPSSLRNCMNIDPFKVQLKTYLFKKAFNL